MKLFSSLFFNYIFLTADPAGIKGDDDFETLTEAGKILIAAKKPDLAVDVLAATMKLDIKRTEAAVAKQQLLIGQALAESENLGASVSSFQVGRKTEEYHIHCHFVVIIISIEV